MIGRLSLLCTLGVLAAPPVVCAQQFTFRQYVQQDGLSNLSVTCLLQDREGYIWVGTENGLFRHDGTDFERYIAADGLADTSIHSVIEDVSGQLWVGTSRDLYLHTGSEFHPVRPDGHALSVSRGSRVVATALDRLLVIDKETLLELTHDGREWHSRSYFSPDQLNALPALSHLSGVYVEPNGRIWLGCGDGICSVEDGHVQAWKTKAGVPKDTWHSWLLDREGNLWARGVQHVLALQPGATTFQSRDMAHSKLTAGILSVPMIQDREGRIITRSDQGLIRWQQGHWQEFTAENGVTTPEVTALSVSRDGSLWLGMSGHGLWHWLGYGTFESWSVHNGLNTNPVWAVLRGPDQTIMMGTRAGCMEIDQSSHAVPCGIVGLPPGEVQNMTRRADGGLWFGMATGELLYMPAGWRRAALIAHVPQMRKLFVDASDRLWISGNYGIRTVAPGSTHVESTDAPEGLGEVTDTAEDEQGALWFATQAGLLRRFDTQWSLLKPDDPTGSGFGSVTPDRDGWFWIAGSTHGLLHVRIHDGQLVQSEWVNDPNIANAAIYFTQLDSRGWLWAGTDEGFVLFDRHVWRKFSQGDGLIWNDTDENAVFADDDDTMWIGTSGGVTHVIGPERLIRTTPLDLRMTRASIGGRAISGSTPSRLEWHRGQALDVHLENVDFGDPKHTMLKVRLRGLSDDWFTTHDSHLHYPGLTPGRYTFEALALDTDHQRASRPVELAFEILPPWWQANWFRATVATLIVVVLAGLWRWSLLRLEARRLSLEHELREREALLERATRDPLTRLWNRQAILEILNREIECARQSRAALVVALVDIDHFKRINDTMGHLTGDQVLRGLAAKLSSSLRARDALGRYGGEELLLVLPDATSRKPFPLVERLRLLISQIPFSYEGREFHISASVGAAWLAPLSDSAEDLLSRADEALYAAKDAGRDRVEYAATGT